MSRRLLSWFQWSGTPEAYAAADEIMAVEARLEIWQGDDEAAALWERYDRAMEVLNRENAKVGR